MLNLRMKKRLLNILFDHFRVRWKMQTTYLILSLMIFLLGVFCPIILNEYYVSRGLPSLDQESMVLSMILYTVTIGSAFLYLFHAKSTNTSIHNELRYLNQSLKFLNLIHQNSKINFIDPDQEINKNILIEYNGKLYSKEYFIRVIISVINIKLFLLYFYNLDSRKYKDIDSKSVISLIENKDFKSIYSSLLFHNTSNSMAYTDLIDRVYNLTIETLDTKSWYKENFKDIEVMKLIDVVLDYWYKNFLNYKTSVQ